MMHETMSRELEEVRNAVREYQLELGSEKQNYHQRLTSLQEELHRMSLDNQQLREAAEARESQMQAEAESSGKLVVELQEKLKS